ncbi:MBL fold metallo-hydrolase [Thermotoga sp. KOL6]|uniref:MBL fold metallo-hydrolase n=1 Tax=Thermotoga sp. KOL6 TaxID=126741 RepID=UPI000C76D6C5|nr:MBL fold metallo-hydrolase [Thermotoga sp. KOL6]PLV59765.1 hypothetical protein AS005_00230 [Thermotoga sp. KOL6]
MLKFRVLGGVGEKGRVGFEILIDKKRIVFDYGVKRKFGSNVDEVYPMEPSGPLDFLFISHSHLDHVGAIPLLDFSYIVCSKPTSILLESQVRNWMSVAGKLLKDEGRYKRFLESSPVFKERPMDLPVKIGRSGHVVGSRWIFLKKYSFLYTGDVTLDSPLYTFDPFPKADVLVVDTAYGIKKLRKREELLNLLDVKDKRIVLPVPEIGRSQEILVKLLENGMEPVFVDENILKGFEFLEKHESTKVRVDMSGINSSIPKKLPYGIYLATDGMITSGTSKILFELLKEEKNTTFVITGHVEEGTPGWKLLNEDGRAISFVWKVHPDAEDLLKIIDTVAPRVVIPFHSRREDLDSVKCFLEKNGSKVLIPKKGEFIDMEAIL